MSLMAIWLNCAQTGMPVAWYDDGRFYWRGKAVSPDEFRDLVKDCYNRNEVGLVQPRELPDNIDARFKHGKV